MVTASRWPSWAYDKSMYDQLIFQVIWPVGYNVNVTVSPSPKASPKFGSYIKDGSMVAVYIVMLQMKLQAARIR